MKKVAQTILAISLVLLVSACASTWEGVKDDSKKAGTAIGTGLEKAAEKIKEIAK
jgi:predicted small secreted protein